MTWAWALLVCGCASEDLEAENQRLEGELGDCRRDGDAHRARLEELERQNQEVLDRMRAMGRNVDDMGAAQSALQAELDAARAREEAARARVEAFRRMLSQFREMIASGQLRVRIVRGRMVVELPENILFDSGSAELKDTGKETLRRVAQILAQIPDREFLVAGHTDNVRVRRSWPSNWELSAARGVVVTRFLAENGVPGPRLAAAGYGPFAPVANNGTPQGREQNRRIEIILMPKLDELPDLSALEQELGQTAAPAPDAAAPATAAPAATSAAPE
jgi:chemotaxis protein MotB